MAILDVRPEMIGRAIDEVRVGPPDHLEPVVNELAEHGIRISRGIVGGDPDMLSQANPSQNPTHRRICDAHQIRLSFLCYDYGKPFPSRWARSASRS
jgi:hypothetical protein